MVSFHPLSQTLHLHSSNLHCGGGFGGGSRCTYVIVTVVVVGLFHPLQHVSVAFFFSPIGAEAVFALVQIALFGGGRCILM